MARVIRLLALTLLLGGGPAAAAQDVIADGNAIADGDIAAGAALAEANCARCHAIAADGASPAEAAPPFRTLGERYPLEYLEEAMAEGLMVAHSDPPMPEFVFSPDEIADLLAYLDSLSAGGS